MAGATLIAPVLEIVKVPSRDGSDVLVIIIAASIVLFGLVVGRMWGLVRQREKSVRRERALTAVGGLLVAATSRQETAAAGLHAVAELAGSETEVPAALTLEITESVIMTDTELAITRMRELSALGVRLAMDDFGTGYSSLSYLSRFPIDVLKMDRSLLAAGASPVTSGLASAVLSLGDTFGLEVVAEGIEYAEQSETLRDLGCEIGQGFFFARPMAQAELVQFMRARLPPLPVIGEISAA